ncbi:MAG TPA: bifunctional DNA primase/polymerase [Candidatus Limnocylindrales bacterium]|nr:bifunctional DNA primase/polymerase [Candidatus Limnocylindrales bacterium]
MTEPALALAAAGYRVFPLTIDKTPLTVNGFRDATTDPGTVGAWWRQRPAALIGVAVPDGTVVVDIDTYKPEYKPDHGLRLPPTAMQETRQGGWHMFYRTDGRAARQTTGKVAPAVDTRVGGLGYVVAWQPEALLEAPPETWAMAPEWVYEPSRAKPIEGTIVEGTRHADLVSLAGSLRARGMTESEIYAALDAVNRERVKPPKADAEIRRIAADFAKKPALEEGELVDDEPEAVVASDTWPEPPAEAAYHGVLGEIARAVAPHTEAHPVAVLGTLLVMFGATCGGARTLYQGSLQRTNLSVLLVGRTGMAGRKGTSLSVGRDVFRLAYPDLDKLWLPGVASGEGIAGHLHRHDGKQDRPYEPRAMLVEPEFGRLLAVMERQGSTLSAALRNAWDGVPLGFTRAREESLVTVHHVSLLGHITPADLKSKLTAVDAENGFVNRILFLAVRREQLVPFPAPPDDVVRPFVRRLHETILQAHDPRSMNFEAAARDRWEAFYQDWAAIPRFGLSGAATGRHEAQVARLALVYALADRSADVGVAHLNAAIALADYARRSVIWALGDSTGNRHADELRRMLADAGELPWQQAKLALGLRSSADMAEAAAVLTDAGLAELVKVAPATGGRDRRILRAKGAKGAKGAGDHARK